MSGIDSGVGYARGLLAMQIPRAALTFSAQGCKCTLSRVLRHAVWVSVAMKCIYSLCKNLHLRFGCYTPVAQASPRVSCSKWLLRITCVPFACMNGVYCAWAHAVVCCTVVREDACLLTQEESRQRFRCLVELDQPCSSPSGK